MSFNFKKHYILLGVFSLALVAFLGSLFLFISDVKHLKQKGTLRTPSEIKQQKFQR